MTIEFKFTFRQKVRVTAYGLNYEGRVIRCIHNGVEIMYLVEYAYVGKIEMREFYEDELEAR